MYEPAAPAHPPQEADFLPPLPRATIIAIRTQLLATLAQLDALIDPPTAPAPPPPG